MNRQHPRRGAAMLYALALMSILGIMASAIWTSMLRETDQLHAARRLAAARQLAEAGINHAMARASTPLEEGREYTLGTGVYTVTSETKGKVTLYHATGMLKDGGLVLQQVELYAQLLPGGGYQFIEGRRP